MASQMPIRTARRIPPFLAALLLAVMAAACSQAATGESPMAFQAEAAGSAPAEDMSGGDALTSAEESAGGGPAPSGEGFAAPIEQRIIKTGEVSVEVPEVQTAVGQVRAFALELGGYVGGSQAGSRDESATLTLRVPAARFDEALDRLRALEGEVVAEATRESDVTRQIVDIQARVANLESSEASYRVLLERAERIEDVLAVQSRLDGVRGEIEQLEAQLQDIEGDADLSTLTVSLIPVDEPVEAVSETWDPGAQFNEALASLVGIGQGLAGALIWIGIVWLPVLLVLALLVLLALRGLFEVRRRMPMAAEPVPASREGPPA
jgi:Domain of unknown function (DUF4349)